MCWVYAPESVESSWGCISPSQLAGQCASSSKTLSADECSTTPRQGAGSKVSTSLQIGTVGHLRATSRQRDSLASPGAPLAANGAPRTTDGSGQKLRRSFAILNPDGSSWKTSQGSLLEEAWESCSPTWPEWGLLQRGACFPASNWEPVTCDGACLLWATPVAGNSKGESSNNRDLVRDAKCWPTPVASESGGNRSPNSTVFRPSLRTLGRQWPTAVAAMGGAYGNGTLKLAGAVSGHQDPRHTGKTYGPNGSRLNSRFVEWLMGFPQNWSWTEEPVCELWETQCRHQLLQWRGLS